MLGLDRLAGTDLECPLVSIHWLSQRGRKLLVRDARGLAMAGIVGRIVVVFVSELVEQQVDYMAEDCSLVGVRLSRRVVDVVAEGHKVSFEAEKVSAGGCSGTVLLMLVADRMADEHTEVLARQTRPRSSKAEESWTVKVEPCGTAEAVRCLRSQ